MLQTDINKKYFVVNIVGYFCSSWPQMHIERLSEMQEIMSNICSPIS